MGQYDRTMKLLVDTNPEAMARFILHEWKKQWGEAGQDIQITSVTLLSEEFQSEELRGDCVWLVEGPEGPLYLAEMEYQSTLDPTMPLRSLEYLARAKKKHWKRYGNLPVIAVVIYLFDEENMPDCPMSWPGLNGTTAMLFHFLLIKLKELEREELLNLHEPALWPLILLTKGDVDRILVEGMFADLLEQKLYDVLPIGHTIAAWFLRDDDLLWLQKEYQKMYEIFKDSPALQWMEASVLEDARKKAEKELRELQKKSEKELRAAQKKAEKELQDTQKKAEKELQDTQKKAEKELRGMFRQTAIKLVAQRFPGLQRLAKAQVSTLREPERLQQLILRLSLARDAEDAQDILFALPEEANEEDIQEATL